MLVIVHTGSSAGAQRSIRSSRGSTRCPFWAGIILLGLVAPFLIEGYPVFITKRVETSTTSLVLSVIGESGVLIGGFLLRLLVVLAALPLVFV